MIRDLLMLIKARVTALVVLTTAVGFSLASPADVDAGRLAIALLGTALAAAGAAALNQVLERDADARMSRTARRPIPAGRMSPRRGAAIGTGLAVAGTLVLATGANGLTAALCALTILLYLGVYTPLKRRTAFNTLVGAIPGAIPPVMGWTAATGSLGAGAWVLFGILFLWQLPHFLAIAWIFRDDYARGGFPMLPVGDPDGSTTGRQVALYSFALVPVSLAPTLLGLTGVVYFFGALALGVAFVGCGVGMMRGHSRVGARRMLLASVTYLPALLALLVLDRAAR